TALADQVLLWMGRAAVLAVPAANQPKAAARAKAVQRALDLYQRAAARASETAQGDPAGQERYGEVLLELAEVQMQFDRAADAARTCELIAEKSLLSKRAEEVQHR